MLNRGSTSILGLVEAVRANRAWMHPDVTSVAKLAGGLVEKQLSSSDRSRAKTAPSIVLRHGFGARAAVQAQQWHERQARALEQADQLIQSVCASRSDCHTSLADVARRAAALLAVARCDILLMDGERRAVRYQMNASARATPSIRRHPQATAASSPTVTVQAMAIKLACSPLELLRSDGPVNRIYVFMNAADAPRPIGILCVQSAADDRLAIDDRALLDALADRLGAALVSGAFTGWREAPAAARLVP